MKTFLEILANLLSNEMVMIAIVGMAAHFYRQWRGTKATAELSAFDLGIKLAYDGVRNWAALHPSRELTKAEKGLELFSKVIKTELNREPTPAELVSAKLHFDAIHAKEAEAKKIYGEMRGLVVADPAPANVVLGTSFQTPPVSP